jgi:hypothetical protein
LTYRRLLLVSILFLLSSFIYANDKPRDLTAEQWLVGQYFSKVNDTNIEIFFKKNHTVLFYKWTTKKPKTFTKFKLSFGKPKLELTPFDQGKWTVNNYTNEVSISNSQRQTFTYKFLPPNDDLICMLIAGSLDNANINQSWVSVVELSDDDPGYQGP